MLKSKYLKLFYYLILSTLGYAFGIYIAYSKILDDDEKKDDFENNGDSSSDKCYTFKKVTVPCV